MMQSNEARKKFSAPLKVAFYVRGATDSKSTKEDRSLNAQIEYLNEFVHRRCQTGENWVVTDTLIEGDNDRKRRAVSGTNRDRPAREKLLKLAQSGLIDILMVTQLDRISRTATQFLGLVAVLEKHGFRFISVRDGIDISSTIPRL